MIALLISLIVAASCFGRAQADDLIIPFQNIGRALVFIDNNGKDTGVGFVIFSNKKGSIVLTDAHVVTAGRVAKAVTLYTPPLREPLVKRALVDPRDVDARADLAILRIPVPSLPTACIRLGHPRGGADMGIAAYTLKGFERNDTGQWTHPHHSMADLMPSTYPIVRNGLVGGSDRQETEFIAELEHGFSGGPIFESRTGLVFGLNQRSIQLENGPSNTLFTVSGLDFEVWLGQHNVLVHDVYVSPSLSQFFPDMSKAMRVTLLSKGASSSELFSPRVKLRLRHSLLRFVELSDIIIDDEAEAMTSFHVNFLSDKEQQGIFYAQLCERNHTAAVIGIEALTDPANSKQTIFRLDLTNCHGDVMKSVLTDALPLSWDSASWAATADSISRAIERGLASNGRTTLTNFFMYGMLIENGEHQPYFSLARETNGEIRASGVSPFGTAGMAGLANGSLIESINGVRSSDLSTLTPQALDQFFDAAKDSGGPFIIEGRGRRTIKFNNGDLCSYLQAESLGLRDRNLEPLPR